MLPEPPSYYMKRQLHGTFQVDDVAIAMIGKTGAEPLLWGSDDPHPEGTYPYSRQTVEKLCSGLEYAEIAQGLAISPATVGRELKLARVWMRRELVKRSSGR